MFFTGYKPNVRDAFLHYNAYQSVFIYDQVLEDKEPTQQVGDNGEVKMIIMHGDSIGKFHFKDLKTKQLKTRDFIRKTPYIIHNSLSEIAWQIQGDTMKIGNYSCQKAVTRFRGRDYTAWFTTQIPINAGPWKLYGLPGLILEAYSTDKEVYFKAKEISTHPKSNIKKRIYFLGKEVSFEEFKKLEQKHTEDLINMIHSLESKGVKIELNIEQSSPIEKDF
jgi:GLPGLI family protein